MPDRATEPSAGLAASDRGKEDEKLALGGAPGLSLPPLEGSHGVLDWLAAPLGSDARTRREIRRLNGLALARISEKDYGGAVEALRSVVNLTPDSFAAHANLGVALWQADRAAEAEVHSRRAISLNRDYAQAYMILGNLLTKRRDFSEGLACYNRVASLEPGNAIAHNNAGLLLRKLGDYAQAETAFARAAELTPEDPRIRFNQLMMRRDDASLPEAIACCRQALELHGDSADLLTNLGVGLQLLGQYDESLASYERALAIDPDQHDARFNLSLLLLLRGDLERGWREYEHRWHLVDVNRPKFLEPMWQGESLEGKTILLNAEQGFGDTIQFLRYVPEVASFGGRVIVRVERPLVRLAASLPANVIIKPAESRLPHFDVWCPLLSLPHVLGTRLESIPALIPYLGTRGGVIERWRRRLAGMPGLRVGLAWAGNARHINDLRRSIGLASLMPLLGAAGVSFVSLQVGQRAADIGVLPRGAVTDISADLTDFAETAGAILSLDLVIGVDTAVVHLAGALGKPAWILLPFSPDWRWMLDRENSPWYPSLRLYRQPALGDWHSVVGRLRADLANVARL
jgi:tetratricopeptide (TPR) repeat protein